MTDMDLWPTGAPVKVEGMPICFNCHKPADQIPGWDVEAKIEGISIEAFARQDGTYNPVSNQFCCDECYMALGTPSAPGRGWRAP